MTTQKKTHDMGDKVMELSLAQAEGREPASWVYDDKNDVPARVERTTSNSKTAPDMGDKVMELSLAQAEGREPASWVYDDRPSTRTSDASEAKRETELDEWDPRARAAIERGRETLKRHGWAALRRGRYFEASGEPPTLEEHPRDPSAPETNAEALQRLSSTIDEIRRVQEEPVDMGDAIMRHQLERRGASSVR